MRNSFPDAEVLTAISWDKNGVYYNMDRRHFPNVKRINYLCGSPGEYCVLFRFWDKPDREFVWGLPAMHHRFFLDLKPECKRPINRKFETILYDRYLNDAYLKSQAEHVRQYR